MTRRAIVLASGLLLSASGATVAQVPNVQIYFDSALTQTQEYCHEQQGLAELYVVMHNVQFVVSAVDFSISYPTTMIWLDDLLPTTDNTTVKIGQSPNGVALAWHQCCMSDGRNGPILVMKPLVLWTGICDFQPGVCPPIVVGGYTPLGKTQPSMIRYPDFTEHPLIGMTSLVLWNCDMPVESTSWGKVKALYR